MNQKRFLISSLFLFAGINGCSQLSEIDSGFLSEKNQTAALIACPEGYARVPFNPSTGTTRDFCVMKFEAKNVGGVPMPSDTSAPWTSISQINARAQCSSLGTGYALITNEEWMTIARNAENETANWSGGSIGSGCLMRGNQGVDDGCSYSHFASPDYGPVSGRNVKAKIILSNASEIWDLAGNVIEWIDWNVPTDKAYWATDGSPQPFDREFADLTPTVSMPFETFLPAHATYRQAQGIGIYVGHYNGVGGGAQRGGHYQYGNRGGLYMLNLSDAPTVAYTEIGFRCVYHGSN